LIDKKVIPGLLTVVILAALQGLAPVMAECGGGSSGGSSGGGDSGGGDPGGAGFATVAVAVTGEGSVCWIGTTSYWAEQHCTQSYQYITVLDGSALTFTATPAAGSTFTSWTLGDVNAASMAPNAAPNTPGLSANTYTLSIGPGTEYQAISASFSS
jgi:hypothetical protein